MFILKAAELRARMPSSFFHESKVEEEVIVPEKKSEAGPSKLAVPPQRPKG